MMRFTVMHRRRAFTRGPARTALVAGTRRGSKLPTHGYSISVAALCLLALPLGAQQLALPLVRDLGPRLAISQDSISSLVLGIRPLSDGRVLVNDAGRHRVILFDSALRNPVIVADSTPGTHKVYGANVGGLLPYYGDTSLFVDTRALSLVVFDPNGKMVRTFAPPQPANTVLLVSGAAFDGRGHFVYSRSAFVRVTMPGSGSTPPVAPPPGAPTAIPAHDSAAIVRGDAKTHVVDTVGYVMKMATDAPHAERVNDSLILKVTIYPVRVTDEWAVVSDGSIALVRASDYHVDWVSPDGSHTASPRIAHEWIRLTDSAKQSLVDSVRHIADSETVVAAIAAKTTQQAADFAKTIYTAADITAVPDYLPPFSQGAVKADADNHLWIREGPFDPSITTVQIYDVVDRQGRLIDRIRLPPSLNLIGFGPGVAYLSSREGSGLVIAKYRIP
jgi:hypothetical protein